MKSRLPNSIKFPLWWIFKSPQRSFGWLTLWQDLAGLFRVFYRKNFVSASLKPISICVGIYNRSDLFLAHFVPSLSQCAHQNLIELSVFDCGSTDMPNLKARIQEIYKGPLIFRSEPTNFTRSSSFNNAVKQANNELLFICDADFSLPKNLVQLIANYTSAHTFWFPIVFYLYKNKPAAFHPNNGEWMLYGGKGILACYKNDYEKAGCLDEQFTSWGGEDEAFYLSCYAAKMKIIRTREKHLLHHWHPSFNPKFKKLELKQKTI